jgi:hypothetical protein
MLDQDPRGRSAQRPKSQAADYRPVTGARHSSPLGDLIASDLDRIGWKLQYIAAALQKCRRYPD